MFIVNAILKINNHQKEIDNMKDINII